MFCGVITVIWHDAFYHWAGDLGAAWMIQCPKASSGWLEPSTGLLFAVLQELCLYFSPSYGEEVGETPSPSH